MHTEDWRRLFHDAGIRIELADICARLVTNRLTRMRSEQVAAARARGLSLSVVAAAFGLSREGARISSSRAAGSLTPADPTLGGAECPSTPGASDA